MWTSCRAKCETLGKQPKRRGSAKQTGAQTQLWHFSVKNCRTSAAFWVADVLPVAFHCGGDRPQRVRLAAPDDATGIFWRWLFWYVSSRPIPSYIHNYAGSWRSASRAPPPLAIIGRLHIPHLLFFVSSCAMSNRFPASEIGKRMVD